MSTVFPSRLPSSEFALLLLNIFLLELESHGNDSHLGPFLLTVELIPLLGKTALSSPDVRVVNVSLDRIHLSTLSHYE